MLMSDMKIIGGGYPSNLHVEALEPPCNCMLRTCGTMLQIRTGPDELNWYEMEQ